MVKLPPMISAEVRAQIAAPDSVSRIGRAYAASSRPSAVAEPRVVQSGLSVSFAVLAAAGGESALRGERLTMDDLASCLGTRREPDGFTPVVAPRGAAAVQQHWADLAAGARNGTTDAPDTLDLQQLSVERAPTGTHMEPGAAQQNQGPSAATRALTFNEILERDREVPSCSSARTRHVRATTDDAKQARAARRFARQQLEARVGALPSGDNGDAFNSTLMNATITAGHATSSSSLRAHSPSHDRTTGLEGGGGFDSSSNLRAKSPPRGGGDLGSAAFLAPERYPEPTRAELWARRIGPGFYRTREQAVSRRVHVAALAPPPVALRDQRRREHWKHQREAQAEALASLRAEAQSSLAASRGATPGPGMAGSDANAASVGASSRPQATTPAPRASGASPAVEPNSPKNGSPAKMQQPQSSQLGPTVAFGRSVSRAETRRAPSTTPEPLWTGLNAPSTELRSGTSGVSNELFITGSVGLAGWNAKSIHMPRRAVVGPNGATTKAVEPRRTYYAAGTPSLLTDIDAARARVVYPRVQTVNLGGGAKTVPFAATHSLQHGSPNGLGSGSGAISTAVSLLPPHPTMAVVPPSAATRLGDWIIAT